MFSSGFHGTAAPMILMAAFSSEALSAFYDLRWMLVFICILIVADFWFGVSDSLNKRKQFRFSRAGRRTCNKLVDYLAYLLVGCTLGLAIFEPLGIANHTATAAIGLGLGCLWEVDSIVGHVCSLHGVTNKFSVKKFLISLLRRKYPEASEALEETINNNQENENTHR